jgi:2-oxoglutarate dehydrogenase E2 component (dihydrolipoamide succinyltransferase)
MAKIEITVPAMGEGIIEVTLNRWLVKEGDKVEEDQPLAEVATDKVDSEIPSPYEGVISKILVQEGDIPKVGQAILILENEEAEADLDRPEVKEEVERITAPREEVPEEAREKVKKPSDEEVIGGRTPSGKFISPLVRSIAVKEGISLEELDVVQGTGQQGRITKNDILAYLGNRPSTGVPEEEIKKAVTESKSTETKPSHSPAPSSSAPFTGPHEVIEMDRMRKLIAEHMVHSKHTSPHVTSFIDADVTNMVVWREKIKDSFQKRENQKITFTPIFIEAAAKALRDFPMINVSVDGTKILVKKNINIGMATALPSGNLIVPVIKNADEKNLVGLAKAVNDLANRARNNKLVPDEISGGTFTITNFGSFSNTTGTPIINQPEVAILGVGAILKKPWVIETPQGDAIAIRHIMTLSLSYDHRVVDGALGGMFLKRVAEYLEDFDSERSI